MIESICGIYKLTCEPTGDFYIGAAKHIEKRKKQHWQAMKRGFHQNPALTHLSKAYGVSSFILEVLEECLVSQLPEKELQWAYKLKPTINVAEAVFVHKLGYLFGGQPLASFTS